MDVYNSMAVPDSQIDFNAAATLRKWPSKENQRVVSPTWPEPYIVIDGTPDACIKKFLLLPINQHHLYEIRTAPQGELVAAVMHGEIIREIARLRDFL